jgi:type I restriction enzyme, R subunit
MSLRLICFKNLSQFQAYADRLLGNDDWRKSFAVYENTITSLFEACKPEIIGNPIVRSVAAFQYLRGVIDSILEQKDLDEVSIRIGKLLHESLVVEELTGVKESQDRYRITQSGKTWDLSKMNFEKLKEEFKQARHKNIEIANLRAFIQKKPDEMLKRNVTRVDFAH